MLDVVHAAEHATGQPITYEFTARRPGDIAACWADPRQAYEQLGWKTHYDLQQMCADAWRWTTKQRVN